MNSGELELLDKMLKDALSTDETYSLRLFKNDYTPINSSLTADFTVADFTNYANKTLSRAGWNASSTVSSKAQSDYGAAQSWTCGASGNTVYGYYVVATTSTITLWAERSNKVAYLSN